MQGERFFCLNILLFIFQLPESVGYRDNLFQNGPARDGGANSANQIDSGLREAHFPSGFKYRIAVCKAEPDSADEACPGNDEQEFLN